MHSMPVLYAYDPIEKRHTRDGHPENHKRLERTMRLLKQEGLLDALEAVPVKPVSRQRLELAHDQAYLGSVDRVAETGGGQLDPDTYANEISHLAARASAGALVGLVEEVMHGRTRRAMSLMRPPGHHALPGTAMGFCIYSNVALAALVARQELGAERVLVVDWDVHHGNGTEAIFNEDPDVAVFSTHQHPFYPGTGAMKDIGSGAGKGFTVNVPFPPGVGDLGYAAAFEEILEPFARRFKPDLLLVSAGYDAHWRDPLAGECLSVAGYAELTRRVVELADELCDGRLVLALEGGYDLEVLPQAILASLRVLQDPSRMPADPIGIPDRDETDVRDLLDEVARLHGVDS
jgi:acetoin utilization deacetylase AcuC-like enzyme